MAKAFEVHAYPVFGMNNDVEQVVLYGIDVTERKRIEEALEDLVETAAKIVQIHSIGTSHFPIPRAERVVSGERQFRGRSPYRNCGGEMAWPRVR